VTPLPPISEKKESIHVVPWSGRTNPKKVLAIRFQAFGDTVITLPYLQALHAIWPSSQIHFLTRDEFSELPRRLKIFTAVHTIGGGRSRPRQYGNALRLVPRLQKERFDVVIDLQRNAMSRMIRRLLLPKSFSEFDRYSLNSAGDRTRATIDKLGARPIPESLPPIDVREDPRASGILNEAGYHGTNKLIVLNPAGNFVTKSWPLEHYLDFANRWIDNVNAKAQFLILGTEAIQDKAVYVKEKLGGRVLNLVGKTTASEAFAILQKAELVVSEDSGLMHMAWVAGVPVVALFGSTRSAWSKPLGEWSVCLNSSDLECGECLKPACRFGDVRCLSRYTAEFIVETAKTLLDRKKKSGT
jgi:heptosyltransferase II